VLSMASREVNFAHVTGFETRLFRMQGKHKLLHAFAQLRQKPHGVGLVLETGDNVVGIAHEDDLSLGVAVLRRGRRL
jgi:hypothetical protein